ncbi:MAG: VanZ family protein [Lachnospiraceae bacterium]|nr:VanZ family protein [Lachnospiraceae bacterium]
MSQNTFRNIVITLLLSLLTVLLELGGYYFFHNIYIIAFGAVLLLILLAYTLMEFSSTHNSTFYYILCTTLLSSAGVAVMYLYMKPLPTNFVREIVILFTLNWLVPVMYSIVRRLYDPSDRILNFKGFFTKSVLLFALYYIPFLAFYTFMRPINFPSVYPMSANSFVPFYATAAAIEEVIYVGISILPLLKYIATLILLFLPWGFFFYLYFEDLHFTVYIAACIAVPLLFELFHYLFAGTFHIDSALFRAFGFFLGIFLCQVMEHLFNTSTGSGMLSGRAGTSMNTIYR